MGSESECYTRSHLPQMCGTGASGHPEARMPFATYLYHVGGVGAYAAGPESAGVALAVLAARVVVHVGAVFVVFLITRLHALSARA